MWSQSEDTVASNTVKHIDHSGQEQVIMMSDLRSVHFSTTSTHIFLIHLQVSKSHSRNPSRNPRTHHHGAPQYNTERYFTNVNLNVNHLLAVICSHVVIVEFSLSSRQILYGVCKYKLLCFTVRQADRYEQE